MKPKWTPLLNVFIQFQGGFNFLKFNRTFNVEPKRTHAIHKTLKLPRAAYSLEIINKCVVFELFWVKTNFYSCIQRLFYIQPHLSPPQNLLSQSLCVSTQITFFPLKYRRRTRSKMQNSWRRHDFHDVTGPNQNAYWLASENCNLVFEIARIQSVRSGCGTRVYSNVQIDSRYLWENIFYF